MSAVKSTARKLYLSTWTHQLVPMSVARPLVTQRATRSWDSSESKRAAALLHMRFLLEKVCSQSEIEEAARLYLLEAYKRNEQRWRPWQTTQQEIQGIEVLQKLVTRRSGVIINFMHHAQYDGIFQSLARVGVRHHAATHHDLNKADAQEYMRRHMKTVRRGAVTFEVQRGSYEYMRDLLTQGQTLAIASDLPGSTRTTILGREILMASGAARLALDTGALVVPITPWRQQGWSQTLRVEEPIDPRGCTTIAEVQAAIAARHEPALRDWPSALEYPLRRWTPSDPEDFPDFDFSEAAKAALPV
jgi:lauroyl/myristoyl acyltransferase